MRSLLPSLMGAVLGAAAALATSGSDRPTLEDCAVASAQDAGTVKPERQISRARALAYFYQARLLQARNLPAWRIAIGVNNGIDLPYAPPLSPEDLQARMKRCANTYAKSSKREVDEGREATVCYAAGAFGYFGDRTPLLQRIEAAHPEHAEVYAAITRVSFRQSLNDAETISSLTVLGEALLHEPLDLTVGRCRSRYIG